MKCFIKLQHGLFNARLSVKEIKVQINVAALSTFNVGCVIGIILNFDKDIRIKLYVKYFRTTDLRLASRRANQLRYRGFGTLNNKLLY